MKLTYKGFDLTKNVQGKLKVFEFPSMPVQVDIEIPVPDKKLDTLLTQKMQDAAKAKLEELQDLFTSEMTKIDARVAAALAKDPSSVDLAREQADANATAKGIAGAVDAHVKTACTKVWEELKKAHKELVKYQLKCAAKVAWSSVKLTVAAARLGASHGADVSAWVSAAKEVYAIAMVIYELSKSADAVQKEVGAEYVKLIQAVAKVKKETNNLKIAARQVGDVEPKVKKVEEKLGVFRPKVTGVDEKSHGLSKSLEKLLNAAKSSKAKLAPKAQAKEAALEQKIDALIVRIQTMQVKVQEMKKYDTAITVTLAAFRADYTKGTATTVKAVDFLQKAKELYDNAKEVIDLVKDVVDLVA